MLSVFFNIHPVMFLLLSLFLELHEIELVILSAYMYLKLVQVIPHTSDLKKKNIIYLHLSIIATKAHSGISRPSLSKFTRTNDIHFAPPEIFD